VLGDHGVELLQLGLPRLREAPTLVELLAGELHEVLVDDVADVLEVADHGDEADLLAAEVRGHGFLTQAREEELDLPLEVIELIATLKKVWVLAIWRAGSLAVAPTSEASG